MTIIRYFNAKLGSANTDEVIGKHGLGEIYNNGERLVEMCIMYYEQSDNRRTDVNSYHYLVIEKIRLKLRIIENTKHDHRLWKTSTT